MEQIERILDILIPILAMLESGGDPNAVNEREGAVGILQIRMICLDDVNRIRQQSTSQRFILFTDDDRFSPHRSYYMCRIYLTYYNPHQGFWEGLSEAGKVKHLARIWNGGPMGPSKASTIPYGEKALTLYKEYKRVEKIKKIAGLFPTYCPDYSKFFGMRSDEEEPRDEPNNINPTVEPASGD